MLLMEGNFKSVLSEAYKKLGIPYMRDYAISSSITYQFIMSPLMCKLLAEADFLETDMTYNENTELTYLLPFQCHRV